MGRALFSAVLDRLFDLVILPLVAVGGMALYGAMFTDELTIALGAMGAMVAGGVVAWVARDRLMTILAIPVGILMPAQVREEASVTVDDFLADFRSLGLRDWARHGLVTALCLSLIHI